MAEKQPLHHPHRRVRSVPMRALSLGLSRTGTCSIQAALNILGVPCFHYIDLMKNVNDCKLWNKAMDAKFFNKGKLFDRADWDLLLGSYGAATDMPTYVFSEDLISAYPEAKVILCERDIDSWYKSFDDNVVGTLPPIGNYLAYLDPLWTGQLRWLADKVMKVYFNADTQDEMRQNAKRVYREHYAMVRSVTPSERLLEFDINDGWEPLCRFLDIEIPDVPFPRVNDTEAAKERFKQTLWEVGTRSARGVVMFSLSVTAAVFMWYRLKNSSYV